ncbi:MAG: YhgE/Pip domain-containing protein [Actinomycetaceae bacterium]|nr:YhgE/Pip domain-containing protein [Actinomycetaceae bacterium]
MTMTLRDWRAVLTVLLLPLLATALTLWSLADRAENFDQVPAAIVNLDSGATMEVDGKEQFVPLGRELAAGLMYPPEDVEPNLDWELVTEQTAQRGLENGDYEAVITIPEKFSSHLTTIGQKSATPALITVTSNDASSELMGVISTQIASAAAYSMGSTLTEQMLDQIYLGFNDMSDQLMEAAAGAQELDEGAQQLSSGLDALQDGSNQLAGGVSSLTTGLETLAGGTRQLSGGAHQLTGGVNDLAAGADSLNKGLHQFRDGFVGTPHSPGLKTGINGLNRAVNGPGGLAEGAQQLADGAEQLNEGVDQLTQALQKITGPLAELEAKLPPGLGDDLPTHAEIQGIIDRLHNSLANSEALLASIKEQLEGSATTVGIIPRLRESVAQCPADEQPEYCARLAQSVDQLAVLVAQMPTSDPNLDAALAEFNQLIQDSGIDTIVDQVLQLQKEIEQFIDEFEKAGGFTGVDTQLTQLREGSRQLSEGARQLSHGIDGTAQSPGLAQGLNELAHATQKLAQGLDGTSSQPGLLYGSEQLAYGLHQLQPGVGQLSQGINRLVTGADQSANGSRQLEGGAWQLADGTSQAVLGASQLIEGTDRFASELADGAEQVPTYTDAERTRMVQMGAVPIRSEASILNEARSGANATFPWAAAFVLWIGAFGTFLAMPGLRKRELAAEHSAAMVAWNSWKWAAVLGLIQAAGVALVATALGVRPTDLTTTTILMVIGALSFAAINQALLAVAGARLGRILALLFLVVQMVSLGGIVPIETAPEAFRALNAILPLSVLTDGLTHTVMGGELTTFLATAAPLAAWGLVAFVLTIVAASKARQFEPQQLRRKYA